MLRVYYSNQTEELLRAFVDRALAHRDSPFEAIRLVVPNRNMERFVKLETARLTGICANVEVRNVHRFLSETTGRPRAGARSLDGVLTTLFDETLLAEPDLAPVAGYLYHAGAGADGVDRRRVQLALEVSRLFRTYEVSRPEILECWRAGLFLDGPATREVEAWQRWIWLHLQKVDELGDRAESSSVVPGEPPPAHLFGIPYLARSDVQALGVLARTREIYVYTSNPCQEIWEAFSEPPPVSNSARRYERRGSDLGPGEVFSFENPFRLSNPGEALPLRLWARPARESLRLMNALTGCELTSRVIEPRGVSLLNSLQRDIVLRRSPRAATPREKGFEGDESIVFLECTSVRRELETTAAEIWSLVSADESRPSEREPLRFHEIAVLLVPFEAPRYQSLVGSVFGEMHGIPFNIADLPIRAASRLAEAASLLLALPLGGFGREEVLRLVTHPAVAASVREAEPFQWVRACERLGIYRGADRRDLRENYVDRDLFTWDQGLKRLALGVFTTAGDVFRNGGEAYVPDETTGARASRLGGFGLLVRSLLADAREAARVQMTLPAWAELLSSFLSVYLKPRNQSDDDVLRQCLGVVAELAEAPLGGRKVGYRIAHEILHHKMQALSGSRGNYLTDGVVVANFVPMRALPFKVIFVLGLDERAFPSRARENHLDLSRVTRRAGDVSARDEDRYLFLETLLCAREKLYLSHVSRDELTGEPLSPSSVVLELKETLLKGYLAPEHLSVRAPPSRRHDDAPMLRASPAAVAEKNAWLVGRSLREHLGGRRLEGFASLPEGVRSVLKLPSLPSKADESRTHVPTAMALADVRRFLECPLQGSVRYLSRSSDGTDPDADEDDNEDEARLRWAEEPFHARPGVRAALLREALEHGGDAESYRRVRETYALRGLVPVGSLGRSEELEHLEILGRCRAALRELAPGPGPVRLRRLDVRSLRLSVGSNPVALSRSPELAIEDSGVVVRILSQGAARFHPGRETLRGFLEHLFSIASGKRAGTSLDFVVINARAGAPTVVERYRFAPLDAIDARSYLADRIEELSHVHPYILPVERVLGERGDVIALERTSSAVGPVSDLERYRRPAASESSEIVARRFGLYFRLVSEVASP